MAKRIKTDPKRVVGYVRVSTDEQNLSPEGQRNALAAWCAANGAELVAVFTDHGVSGGAAIADRPGLLAALAAMLEHGAGVLLAAKRDRLARDTMVAAMLEREAARCGATVRTVDGAGDGDSPEAMLMRRMVDAFAEYERLLIRARTKSALRVKRDRGERVSGVAPFGYRFEAGRVVADAAEQRVVALVRAYRAEGLTLRAVADRLAANGILPRNGGAWRVATLHKIAA